MRINETRFFIFIASIIVGILISMNIKFDNTSAIILNSSQYKDFYKTKESLQEVIASLSTTFESNYKKLKKYEKGDDYTATVSDEIKKEQEENNLLLGKEAVSGPGIVISLQDITTNPSTEELTNEEIISRTLHDHDFIILIGILRSAGAKAISINNVRLTYNSSIVCAGSFIMIDDIKIPGPFEIKAIGNKDVLVNYMTTEDNYIKYLQSGLRNINVTLTPKDNIKIPSYLGDIKKKYMTDIK